MFTNNILQELHEQSEKENYIANMLIRTLYSNNVNQSECYRIIKLFEEKVIGRNTDSKKDGAADVNIFNDKILAKELSIAKEIALLISSKNITYREWEEIFYFTNEYIKARRDSNIFTDH